MKMKTGLWVVVLLVISSVSYGAGRYQEVKALLVDDVRIQVNGQAVSLKDTGGAPLMPINYNGRTYLPIRSVADLVNYDVEWNPASKTIALSVKSGTAGTAEEEESGYASMAAVAYTTGKALNSKDYAALADLVHPEKGVRFSINGSIVLETDVVLSQTDFKSKAIGGKSVTWGVEDGSAAPMVMTVSTFMDRFNKDFENPVRSGYNERVTGFGIKEPPQKGVKILEGGESIYAGSEFVEYYFEGSSGQEFDWNSFVLIFEMYQGKYYLVGVLHNYWLI